MQNRKEMKTIVNSLSKSIYLTIVLSFMHSILGEAIFYFTYYNDTLLEYWIWFAAFLIIAYSTPIVYLFKAKYLKLLFLLLIFTPLNSIIMLFVCGKLFPIHEEDFGAGVLGIFLLGFNLLLVIVGTFLGIIINLLQNHYRKSRKELGVG
jgi:hypothetical protein